MNRRETKVGLLACFAFLIAFPGAISGGLLIAPLIAFCALVFLPLQPISWRQVDWAWPLVPALLFLIWAAFSYLWSPHDNPEQIPKTVIGIPLYALFAWRVGGLDGPWRERLIACVITFAFASALFFVFESITGGHGTISFKIGFEDADTRDMRDFLNRVHRSLGHGVAVLVLVAGPIAALIWSRGHRIVAISLLVLTLWAALSFGMTVNAVASIAAGTAVLLASLRPRIALSVVFTLLAGFIVVMPVFMPSLIALMPDGLMENLPPSWVWRLHIWEFASERISERPWLGYGLDASRQIGDGMLVSGVAWDVLPLHPHNAALHIWLETGLIGVILLAATLMATGDMLSRVESINRTQILALIWVITAYACLLVFSYGVWQEWHQASLAMAIAVVRLLKPQRSAREMFV